MNLNRRKTLQRFYYGAVSQLQCFFHRFALDHFSGHGAGSDSGATAEGFKLNVFDDAVFNFQVHFHNIAAFGVSNFSYAVGILNFSHVSGVGEMVHDFFRI